MLFTDEELMRQAKAGNVAAFGEIFDRYQRRLVAFLIRFTGNVSLGEDLAQETLWRVWENRGKFDGRSAFHTWLFVIARNLAINEARRAARGQPVPISSIAESDWSTPAVDADDLSVREEVRAALLRLPDDQRLCLILREYEELSHREVADVLGCSEGAARVLAHRARQTLRRELRRFLECEDCCNAR